ncbi:galactokinase [Paenibacillus tarimensis]|uniref:galactokinase n=1 Tax=Paenibacillus tarimensis TaxID=416012 RepID=UPI001F34804D|nr:galactokinase family protein [Paenibacillus tarimensis]MCF2945380.1 galactokinase [Paenibacillus tarimensis]
MLTIEQTKGLLQSERAAAFMTELYGKDQLQEQLTRYSALLETYQEHYGSGEVALFSAPGRSEIGGNHTDHNHGKVLAASINLDTIAAAGRVEESVITIISEGYPGKCEVDLRQLEPAAGESPTCSLIRGIAAGCVEAGHKIGGFKAYVTSNVLSASGLSSSASFEMLVCSILSAFYNEGALDALAMSQIGKYAENRFWNKPSGMLDQMACAYGGLVAIDFEDPAQPVVTGVAYDFRGSGYSLVIVSTGGNHADLTEDYAAVPGEMRAVAQMLGRDVLRGLTPEDVYRSMEKLRQQCGDRAVLRALHFFAENDRVDAEVQALERGDMNRFLGLIKESGNSSWKWLQNCYRESDVRHQGITVALAITENYLQKLGTGACRVHGGGFAGVILTILPVEEARAYAQFIHDTIGTSSYIIQVRQHGAILLNQFLFQ